MPHKNADDCHLSFRLRVSELSDHINIRQDGCSDDIQRPRRNPEEAASLQDGCPDPGAPCSPASSTALSSLCQPLLFPLPVGAWT